MMTLMLVQSSADDHVQYWHDHLLGQCQCIPARSLVEALPAAVREALIHMLSDDSDRYNRTFAALVLERLAEDDPDARERLIASLLTSRWCPVTNSTNPF